MKFDSGWQQPQKEQPATSSSGDAYVLKISDQDPTYRDINSERKRCERRRHALHQKTEKHLPNLTSVAGSFILEKNEIDVESNDDFSAVHLSLQDISDEPKAETEMGSTSLASVSNSDMVIKATMPGEADTLAGPRHRFRCLNRNYDRKKGSGTTNIGLPYGLLTEVLAARNTRLEAARREQRLEAIKD
ncbi:unnamed protein product [Protopolystoma xenopodis]|uniref:Uncharacterized protein n=1 Tax=Protopolystoma xenopodis TaxID=117903 RepID=A0A448WUH6_9PLAT|nr:unnamed protein product [Protopolystoma xenopodis]